MNASLLRLLLAVLVLAATSAEAAITCSVSSPGFAAAYSSTAPTANVTQTWFTVTCTRGSAADPSSVNYSVKADNGLHSQGQRNRATFGANRMSYDLYTNASCSTEWRGNTAITGTITFAGTGTVSQQGNFWGCVPASQTGLAAGTYTDDVTMTMTYGAPQSTATGSASVVMTTPPVCSVTTAPGTLAFTYVSFGPIANANTSFGVTCTLALPYSVALDATSGTILGLSYTLSLGTTNASGTGSEQTIAITGSIPAGQSGTCATSSCVGLQGRSVTVTY